MGDAQSAQREGRKDAAAEEESGKVDDARPEQGTDDKPLSNNGQISEMSGKADSTIAEVNGHCEDEITAEAILSPDEEISEETMPTKEEIPVENVEINEEESHNEVDANKEVDLEMTEMDAKQNDINEGFRRFFNNIGLKLTVKRGSADKAELATDVPDETNKEETNRPEEKEENEKDTKNENAEQNIDLKTAQETYDNDSTTCPTLTDVASEDILESAEEKTTEAREEAESENIDEATASPIYEDKTSQQDVTLEEDLLPTSPSSSEAEMVVSPIKRFFTTGIFSGLRKKKKSTEDEATEKELVEIVKKNTLQETEKNVEVQQDREEISPGFESATVETGHKENLLKEESLSAASALMTDDRKSPPTDPAIITVNEPEITISPEKVEASPLKRLLSGSSLKKVSKKQRRRKSSKTKLSDSGEHFSDQLMSSTESDDNQREESPTQHSAEVAGEEDGAWTSFKKLVTPKKLKKRSSLTNEETQIPASDETKPTEGGQISDHSADEGKKRKESSVSWEAVLCGSGRRSRSQKTSDSEDETPQVEHEGKKQESPLESSNEVSDNKQAGSPSEGDGGSTWKSFKKLVTPKRKSKDEEESKDNIQSDSDVTQDVSSFSIKKLLPGQKKRKSAEKQDQVSSDEADKEIVSGDEDSETPVVVPLSEFDTTETGVKPQDVSKEADYELQQDLLEEMAEPVPTCPQTEAERVQDNEYTLENEASTAHASNEEPEELTELISKHQQLSDIPEEGIITETIVTPTSVTEEAARDDTIAEDLIEITSEAITAPEPVDITLADETEMISAVSQLSESSKTSGNTTPVPAEYDVKHTEELLHQAVETIAIIPKAVLVCSDEVNSETIAGSVSHQILETIVNEQTTLLEIHRRSDATAFNTGLHVEELDVIDKFVATPETESISEVKEAVFTEMVSEVSTDVFDKADIAVDEVNEVYVSHQEESIRELESTDESQHLVGSHSEVDEAMSIETVPEGEKIVADESSLVGDHQDKNEHLETEFQEAESAATVAVEENATFNSEEGSVQSHEEEVMSKAIPEAEIATDEPKEETEPLTGVSEPVKAFETEHVQELEVLEAAQSVKLDSEEDSIQSLEKEVVSEEIPPAEMVTDELPQGTEGSVEPEEELSLEDAKTEHVQEVVLTSDINDIATEAEPEVGASMPAQVTESIEEGRVQELEPDTKNDVTSVTDETESKAVAEMNEDLEVSEDKKTEIAPLDVQVGQEDHILEVVDELQTLTAVHISPVVEEASTVQVRESLVFSEGTPALCVDNVEVTQEPMHEVCLSGVQASLEGEKESELSGAEIKGAAVEQSTVAQMTKCNVKDVPVVISDVLMEKTSNIHEPLLESVASEVEFEETMETVTPLVKDDFTRTAEGGSAVKMMHVPSQKFEDNHRIQVQVVDIEMKSANMIVDTVLEVGVTEVRELREICHEPAKADEPSATSETGEEITNNKNQGAIQEDNQNVKENLQETVPEVLVNLEQEVMKQPDAVTEASEMPESEPSEMEDQKVMEESVGAFREEQDEVHAVISEDSATEQHMFEDVRQTPDIPESIDVSIHDPKEDLEETKAELEKSEADVTTEEVKLSSVDSDVKKINEEAQIPQFAQSQSVTPSNNGLVVPQNTGIISSIGNVESPSSLSLEFKLNIQFGQAKAQATPPPTTERIEQVKKTDVSEIGVQAVAPEKEIYQAQSAENQKQTESTEVSVQAPEITKPEPANLDLPQTAEIMNKPVLLNVGMEAIEIVEPVEQIKSTKRVTPNIQATETLQAVRQTGNRGVLLGQSVISEACYQETKAEPVKQTEEENDQDVWMDAEEDIDTKEAKEVSLQEEEEPLEHLASSGQEDKAVTEHESAMAPDSKIEEKDSQKVMLKRAGRCDFESEGEDFSVAPEDLENATATETAAASITTVEWD